MHAFELRGVSKRYGRRFALEEVDLEAPRGACLGLLGPNGAGKTTALRLLLGFARPSRGRVRLHDRDPRQASAREGVGYLPERLVLPRSMSVRRFLELHGRLAGLEDLALARGVAVTLERCGVAEHAAERVDALSKGLAQRVGFAQALLGEPRLLLLDEPTSGLDPLGVRDARDWILAARARGATVLVSSHRLSEVERTCDRVAILHRGRRVASGSLDELVRPGEDLEDAFVRAVEP
jgi:ABC-2 type transport system ATP-binding protein